MGWSTDKQGLTAGLHERIPSDRNCGFKKNFFFLPTGLDIVVCVIISVLALHNLKRSSRYLAHFDGRQSKFIRPPNLYRIRSFFV